MAARHALIAGATGIVGRRLAERLHAGGWTVTGLCRRLPASPPPYAMVSVDLTDPERCRASLGRLNTVTHVFYTARYDHPEGAAESVQVNAGMLENLVEAIEPTAHALHHVHVVHGTKYYGHMLGPLQVPLSEDSPRARVPNFYFAQEDFIRERRRSRTWSYSTSRPHTFCDADASEPRNAALLIAVYATLARELDLPLIFPASERSFHARTQFTYVPMLAAAIEWMASEVRCANQSYNVVNGDSPRWSELWPRFADYFGIPAGGAVPMRLQDYIGDEEAVWQGLVERFGLDPVALSERVLWPYADYLFSPEWDIISSMSKARGDGFNEGVDSARMFIDLFESFRLNKIIP